MYIEIGVEPSIGNTSKRKDLDNRFNRYKVYLVYGVSKNMAYSSSLTQGVILLLYLHIVHERGRQDLVPSKMLSEYTGIPLPTTVKILKGLSATGITATKEGYGGGNILVKPLSQITLFDVFMAVEQDTTLFKLHNSIPCDHDFVKNLKERLSFFLNITTEAMKENLKTVTLEQVYLNSLGDSER
jgi:Rrf2 family protein